MQVYYGCNVYLYELPFLFWQCTLMADSVFVAPLTWSLQRNEVAHGRCNRFVRTTRAEPLLSWPSRAVRPSSHSFVVQKSRANRFGDFVQAAKAAVAAMHMKAHQRFVKLREEGKVFFKSENDPLTFECYILTAKKN